MPARSALLPVVHLDFTTDAHTDQPLTLAAARVSPRALQDAFHCHDDTTPMGHLRRVRLDHAHQDLTHDSR
ncbi:transcriptional regulator GlxA family with amidase domain [Kutzneria viridogrisea]|uniref:Transcriptional regulator GlxA family with amidase domain n=1 Tax=Kutzneria viridogrisea TaxID=47990 RepID=A0ABR6BIL4_9PSEU|nr:transcriptional regulator GlxA family with amidase domain [Kutzneria viridogrisea]